MYKFSEGGERNWSESTCGGLDWIMGGGRYVCTARHSQCGEVHGVQRQNSMLCCEVPHRVRNVALVPPRSDNSKHTTCMLLD